MPSERTIKIIELQGSKDVLNRYDIYGCGCERKHQTGKWNLCDYHQGFDDASEKADELQALIDAYAVAWHSRGIFDAAGERRMIEARNVLLAAATKEDDRG